MEYKGTKGEEIVKRLPSVKIGLDDHYGKQTVTNCLNTLLKQRDEAVEMLKRCENWVKSCNQYASIGNDIEKLIKSITESK